MNNSFKPISLSKGFLSDNGIKILRDTDAPNSYGLKIISSHLNQVGIAHGGLLATFADTALGHYFMTERRQTFVTVNLNVSYVSPAIEGEFLNAIVSVVKGSGRTVFADVKIRSNERLVLSGSGVFTAVR